MRDGGPTLYRRVDWQTSGMDGHEVELRLSRPREAADLIGLRRARLQFGPKAIPQGNSPTWIDLITRNDATSMTEMSFETPLATSKYFSSGVKAPCQTRCPTNRYFRTACVTPSTTATRLAGPRSTKPSLPSLVRLMPTGWIASDRRPGISNVTVCLSCRVAGSIMARPPPISEVPHNSDPSALNAEKRGREPTSRLPTISRLAVSIKWTMLVVSDAHTKILESGLTAMPSGSMPTDTWPMAARFSRSMTVTIASFSLAP